MFWNAIKTGRLELFVRTGRSASEIARELGMTRNAIIGKCNRAGFSLQGRTGLDLHTVQQIAWDLKNTDSKQYDIADKYSVDKSTVIYINTGRWHSDQTGASTGNPLRRNYQNPSI